MLPKISVIIPVYNTEKYLRQCLDSVVNQTLKDIEIICVDDGSTDNSMKILEEYKKSDLRIRVYYQTNLYAGIARNTGIKYARGEYITFLDSDDIMVDNGLEMLLDRALETSADIVISSAYYFTKSIDEKKSVDWILRKRYIPEKEVFNIDDNLKYIFQMSVGVVWARLYRTDFIKKWNLCFPKAPCSEDFYFLYLSYVLAEKIAILDKETIFYRDIPGSNSLEHTKDKYPGMYINVREQLYKKIVEFGMWDKVKQSFVNQVIHSFYHNIKKVNDIKVFEIICHKFRNEIIYYDIDLSSQDYFYFKEEYNLAKLVCKEKDLKKLFDDRITNNNSHIKMKSDKRTLFNKMVTYYRRNGLYNTIKRVIEKLLFMFK